MVANDDTDLVNRLRNVLKRVELDCDCRRSLCDALDRFATLEQRRKARGRLMQARDQKDRILAMLAFLSELDQISDSEADHGVFEEMALLFVEIANCANVGAASLRALAGATS
jgi:hypothetical protein